MKFSHKKLVRNVNRLKAIAADMDAKMLIEAFKYIESVLLFTTISSYYYCYLIVLIGAAGPGSLTCAVSQHLFYSWSSLGSLKFG